MNDDDSTQVYSIVQDSWLCRGMRRPKPRQWVVSYSLQFVRFSFWKSFCTHRELTCDVCELSSKLERVPELK